MRSDTRITAISIMGHDPAVCGLAARTVMQWALGHPIRAMHCEGQALAMAQRLVHAPSLTHALWPCAIRKWRAEM